nr:hypothetical protein [Tanacetum cinerariifolium]
RVHTAGLQHRIQSHQGPFFAVQERRPRHGDREIPAGEKRGPGRAHGRHPGIRRLPLSGRPVRSGVPGGIVGCRSVDGRAGRRHGPDSSLLDRAPYDASQSLSGKRQRGAAPTVQQPAWRAVRRRLLEGRADSDSGGDGD